MRLLPCVLVLISFSSTTYAGSCSSPVMFLPPDSSGRAKIYAALGAAICLVLIWVLSKRLRVKK